MCANARKNPRMKLPLMLMMKVPHGKISPQRAATHPLNTKRAIAPKNPPSPTHKSAPNFAPPGVFVIQSASLPDRGGDQRGHQLGPPDREFQRRSTGD